MKAAAWVLALVALAGLLAVGLVHRLRRHHHAEGAAFVTLPAGQPVRFAWREAPWVEIVVRPATGVLRGQWLGEGLADPTAFELALDDRGAGRTFRLSPPVGAQGVELTAASPLLARVLRAEPSHGGAGLRRLAFLASARKALRWSWKAVAPSEGAALQRLGPPSRVSPAAPVPRPPVPDGDFAFVAGQARGWAVQGPGALVLRWAGSAPATAALTGTSPQTVELSAGLPRPVMLPEGWSWLRVRTSGEGRLELAPPAGRLAPVPTERPLHAHLLVKGQVLRFPLLAGEDAVVRWTAWAPRPGATGAVRWRLGALHGERALPSSEAAELCQVSAQGCAPVGAAVVGQVAAGPTLEGAALEVSTDGVALVAAESLFEPGADPRPRPPFDEAPEGFEWQGAPSRASRWVFLRPAGDEAGVVLSRSATLTRQAPHAVRSTMALAPGGARRSTVVLEPGEGRGAAFVPITPGREREVRVDATGAHARRLGLSCVNTEVGGAARLVVDGRLAGERAFTSTDPWWELPLEPGLHRVQLGAPATARCHVVARPASGGWRKRTVFPAGDGRLEWVVTTSPAHRSKSVGFAIYGQAGTLGPLAAVGVQVDGGRLQRLTGAVDAITSASRRVPLGGHAPVEVRTLGNARAFDRLGVVRVTLGEDLAPGPHRISLAGVDTGALWFRAWTDGHRARPERAEGWITTEEQ